MCEDFDLLLIETSSDLEIPEMRAATVKFIHWKRNELHQIMHDVQVVFDVEVLYSNRVLVFPVTETGTNVAVLEHLFMYLCPDYKDRLVEALIMCLSVTDGH